MAIGFSRSAGSGSGVILPWTTATAYKQGQPGTQAGQTYTSNADHTSGASFNPANWTALPTLPGTSLGTVDGIAAPATMPSTAAYDVPGGVTPTITIPDSGRIRVEAFTPWLSGSLVGAVAMYLLEAPVTNGVIGAYGATVIAAGILSVTVAGKGTQATAVRPLARTPGAQFVYKMVLATLAGGSLATISTVGYGGMFIDVTAR